MKKFALLFFATCALLPAEEWTDLWPGEAPGAPRPPEGSETIEDGWRYGKIEVPQYQLFKPEKSNGQAVVILPGGGYTILAMDHEGLQVGKWLAGRGITAMVVKYRVSGDDSFGYKFPVPQMDARRAIRTLRANAEKWGVDPKRVGIMGFSAGGHLAATCATQFNDKLPQETTDQTDALSARPDFAILCYAVVAIGDEKFAHKGSAIRLLGKEPDPELLKQNNAAARVTSETPPTFLLHAADDQSVPLQNTTEFALACAAAKVPVRAHIYETGGHGFGLEGRDSTVGWKDRLAEWLDTNPGN